MKSHAVIILLLNIDTIWCDMEAAIDCSSLPTFVNGIQREKGCHGAVWSDGSPSKQYCVNDDKFPWWKKCCQWHAGKCIPKGYPTSFDATITSNASNVISSNVTSLKSGYRHSEASNYNTNDMNEILRNEQPKDFEECALKVKDKCVSKNPWKPEIWKDCLFSWWEGTILQQCRKCMEKEMSKQCDPLYCKANFRKEFYKYLGVPEIYDFCIYIMMIPIGTGCNPNNTGFPDLCKNNTGLNETWFYYEYDHMKCEPFTRMMATNVEDAKAECSSKPNKECRRFMDHLNQGKVFSACPGWSSMLPSVKDGDVVYNKVYEITEAPTEQPTEEVTTEEMTTIPNKELCENYMATDSEYAEAADNDIKRCPDGYEEVKKKKSCQEACCQLEIPFNQNEEFKDSKPDFKNDRNCFIRKNKCSQKKMHGSRILCIRGGETDDGDSGNGSIKMGAAFAFLVLNSAMIMLEMTRKN